MSQNCKLVRAIPCFIEKSGENVFDFEYYLHYKIKDRNKKVRISFDCFLLYQECFDFTSKVRSRTFNQWYLTPKNNG